MRVTSENSTGTEVANYYPPKNGFIGNIENSTLKEGTLVDRFGAESGSYVSPKGTPIEMRALPSENIDRPYMAYRVTKTLAVTSGRIAPAFDKIGLGIQYLLPDSVGNLVDQGFLERLPS